MTLAVCRGFQAGAEPSTVAVHCVQPAGNDTIATPLREGLETARAVACATAISGLQVASVIDGNEVVRACRRSGGTGHTVTDEEVWELQRRLAREEGIFCEPAGAVALAGALGAWGRGEIGPDSKVVCLVTGSGFKDASAVARMNAGAAVRLVDAEDLE